MVTFDGPDTPPTTTADPRLGRAVVLLAATQGSAGQMRHNGDC